MEMLLTFFQSIGSYLSLIRVADVLDVLLATPPMVGTEQPVLSNVTATWQFYIGGDPNETV